MQSDKTDQDDPVQPALEKLGVEAPSAKLRLERLVVLKT